MTNIKLIGIFNGFINLELIEFKILIICLVIRYVSRRKDGCYEFFKFQAI
jgi:hypothetical protein